MFKKLCCVAFSFIAILYMTMCYRMPVFSEYAKDFELYLNCPSSTCQIIKATKLESVFIGRIYGESFKADKNFDAGKLVDRFNAKLVKVEVVNGIENYYYYSPKIKYKKQLFGERVNIHVAVTKTQITIGSPIIFGSF